MDGPGRLIAAKDDKKSEDSYKREYSKANTPISKRSPHYDPPFGLLDDSPSAIQLLPY